MIELIVFFLVVSLVLYTIFAGADFGAGILELFSPSDKRTQFRELVNKTIGPVWESNHIWLILVVVIIFSAFPEAYSGISTIFHFPLLLMLFGIVLRGCAFTFRHYDTGAGGGRELYSRVFAVSSLLTPFSQGMIAGGLIMAKVPAPEAGFLEYLIFPWLNIFCISVGLFLCLICSLTAAVFLYCEGPGAEFIVFLKKSIFRISILTFVCGLFVFLAAEAQGFGLYKVFFSNFLSLVCFVLAIIVLLCINFFLVRAGYKLALRGFICAFVSLILAGWAHLQYPYLMGIPGEGFHAFNIYEIAAPAAVLKQLLIALVLGSFLIFPALFYLIKTFKGE